MKADLPSRFTFVSRYARYDDTKFRRNTEAEQFRMLIDMFKDRAAQLGALDKLEGGLEEAYDALCAKELVASQRALQFAGAPMLKNHAKGYNCCYSFCDRSEFFSEGFWLLLCGAGVGFSVQRHHVDQLPEVLGPRAGHVFVWPVDDSIEGWAEAVGALTDSYFFGFDYVEFDFSQIRPKGSDLSSGVGKAPGPEPLMKALANVRKILDSRIGMKLRTIDAYDIFMHLADAVISGGVRRSATLALISPDDEDMINAKRGNWYEDNKQRARSNNSVVLERYTFDEDDLRKFLSPSGEHMGDLGIYLTSDTEVGCNPCGEISLDPVDDNGDTGWAFCNLTEINGRMVTSLDDGLRLAHLASLLGTIQASFTDFPFLGPVSEGIARRDALLGVSITGLKDNRDLLDDEFLQGAMARQANATNHLVSGYLGINPAKRVTCVKPSGKASVLMGTSSGISARKAPRVLRRIQFNMTEPPAVFLMEKMYEAGLKKLVEPGAWGTDGCISLPEHGPLDAIYEAEETALSQLKHVQQVKQWWVNEGHRDGTETHNVSNTINISDEEWDDVIDFIMDNQEDFSGLSFQRKSAPLEWPQAPQVPVLDWHQIMDKHGPLIYEQAKWMVEDWLKDSPLSLYDFVQSMAPRYREVVHELAIWNLYQLAYNSGFDVDFTELVEYSDETNLEGVIACGEGACEI